jgi:hypothetical protein
MGAMKILEGSTHTGHELPPREAFSLQNAEFRYDPYPIGCAKNIFPENVYDELLDAWPDSNLFQFKPNLGNKYSLSELNNPNEYHAFISRSPLWARFYKWIKSEAFVRMILGDLKSRGIDLALTHPILATNAFSPVTERFASDVRAKLRRWAGHAGVLRTRFEFSMLPADGGSVLPHTDAPQKLITLVLSMVREGEWNPAWGGATLVERPKDITKNFNLGVGHLRFEEMERLDAYQFEPNQCVIFVKTFNSFHSVQPMTGGHGNATMRRTLTINIERVA